MDLSDQRVLGVVSATYSNVQLTEDLVRRLRVSDTKKTQLMRWKPAFGEAMIDMINSRTWSQAASRFTADRRVNLEFCATELEEALTERRTTESDLKELVDRIEELQQKLAADPELDEPFRILLNDLFETVRRACSEYLLRGNQGVIDAMSYIFISLHKYSSLFDSPGKRAWGEKLKSVLSTSADIATVTGLSIYATKDLISGFLN